MLYRVTRYPRTAFFASFGLRRTRYGPFALAELQEEAVALAIPCDVS